MKAIFSLCIMALLFCRAIAFADTNIVASSPEWLALLHFQGSRSQITDNAFFLSSSGKTDPRAELQATLREFRKPKSNSQCRFPARLAYLKQVLFQETKHVPVVKCIALEEYLSKVPFDKVSLSFATEHIPNPTTMMGHLFLKIQGTQGDTNPTHSLSFFADLNKVHNMASFIVGSLFTGIDGIYILEPYKNRRDAYLYEGKRSIWDYELKFTEEQRKILALHIWEMRGINVSYDLRENNCGSAIIRLLMAADPSLESVLYKNYITPADILRKLNEKGQFASTTFIPSQLYTIRNSDGHGGVVPPSENVTSKAHATAVTADFNAGYDDFLTFDIAPAYNQLMQRNAYTEQEYEVNLFRLQLGTSPELNKLNVQKFDLVSFQSYLPVKKEDASLSSALTLGLENKGFGMDTDKVFPKMFGGAGYTFNLSNNISAYGILHGGYSYYNQDNILSIAPEVGSIIRQGNIGKAQLSYQTYTNTARYKYRNRVTLQQSFFLEKDLNLNLHYEHSVDGNHQERDFAGIGIGLSF